jgi:hypothetical protein
VAAILVLALILVVGHFDKRFAWGAVLSVARGELATLYLMDTGLSRIKTILFVTAWSSLSVYNFYWAGNQIESVVKKLLGVVTGKLRTAFNITAVIPEKKNCAAETAAVNPGKFSAIAKKFPYFMVVLYCFNPIFGVPLGIAFAKSLKLNMRVVLAILLAANSAEKIFWGYFLGAMLPYLYGIVVPIVFLSFGIVIAAGILRLIYFGNGNHGSP